MNILRSFILTTLSLTTLSTVGRAVDVGGGQNGDVVYTLQLSDSTSTLTNNIYYYNTVDANGNPGNVEGGFGDVSYSDGVPQVENVGNPFNLTATAFGLLGIDNITSGATTNLSVYVGFNTASTVPINESFTTFFAPFFDQHPDLTLDENTIVAALQNPDILDDATDDESGRVIYQFRDYVISLQDQTMAPIDTGLIDLVHFSGGTSFGSTIGAQTITPAPEPSTWAMLLLGAGTLAWISRKRARAV